MLSDTYRLAFVAFAALVIAGCATSPAIPPRSTTTHFATLSGNFAMNPETRVVRYIMRYGVVEPFQEPVSLRIEFENPRPEPRVFVVERKLLPDEREFEVESPELPAIQQGGTYTVVLLASSSQGVELARHEQAMRFLLPPGLPPAE